MIDLIYFLINNPCEDPNILRIILFIRKIMEIAFIAVPIVLIVLITFDFIKNVTANSEDVIKKNQKIVIKRLIYAVMLFFVIPIVNLTFSAFDSSGNKELYGYEEVNYLTCWTNASDIETIDSFEKIAKFNGNGGTVYGDTTKSCGGFDSCELKSLSRASKNGYVFLGWSTSADCNGTPVNKVTLTQKEETLYACYEKGEYTSKPTPGLNSNEVGIASDWWWPIQKDSNGEPLTTHVSSKYGPRNVSQSTYHYGIDISQGNAPEIIASYDGVIDEVVNTYKGTTSSPNYGNYVIIKHNINGTIYYSYYAHMAPNSIPSTIKVGNSIAAGTVVGKMGQTGYSFGIHLHFEVRKNSKSPRASTAIDPLKLIDPNNPYPQKSNGNVSGSTSSENIGTPGESFNCNGKTVTISNKDGVTYINGIIVVNKTYSLPSSYNPEGLSNASQLASNALNAFNNMASAIKTERGLNISILSGFRSYSTQQSTYNGWVNTYGKTGADRISARAGHSEHQTGLAVDINSIKTSFKDTNEGKWLNNNAYKYGFILRYPENKESITGYSFEPWHYRFVGKDLAKELYNNGNWITVEEYFCIDSKYK